MTPLSAALPLNLYGTGQIANRNTDIVARVTPHACVIGLGDYIIKATNDHAMLIQTLQTARTLLSDPTPFNVLEASHLINKTIAEVEK